jgi:hypothetical protein
MFAWISPTRIGDPERVNVPSAIRSVPHNAVATSTTAPAAIAATRRRPVLSVAYAIVAFTNATSPETP